MSSSIKRRHPHDLAFRFVFSRVDHARGALSALVGQELADRLQWSTLRLEPGTYVEEALRDSMSDLLFSVALDDVHDAEGFGDYRALLEYVWSAGSDDTMIEAIIEHTREELRAAATSVAEMLETRGWERGRAEGEQKGRALLLRMLEHRFGALPEDVRARVLAAEPVHVEEWTLRVLDATVVEDVFGDP